MKNFYFEHLQSLDKSELIKLLYKPQSMRRDLKYKSTRTIALRISYDGSNYSGLAEYKFGNTIGNHIRNALELSQLGSRIVYAGRTDAGVSAVAMVASCEVKSRLESPNGNVEDEFNYEMMLNCYLPKDIRITGWAPVSDDFSARFSCIQRSYRYYFHPEGLDLVKMQEMADKIKQLKNFYELSKHSDKNARYSRTLDCCEIVQEEDLCYLDIRARSFLHNMVRKIFWVLEKAGRGEEVEFTNVGIAEPQNLVFMRASYSEDLTFIQHKNNYIQCRKEYKKLMQNGIEEQETKIIKIKVQHVRNKKITKLENIPSPDCDRVLDVLKKKMACGGSKHPDGTIQIQGDKTHTDIIRLVKELVDGCKVEMNGKVS